MAYQTATNPDTGEKVVLIGNKWQPYTQSATGPQGAKAYLVKDKWIAEETPWYSPERLAQGAKDVGLGALRGAAGIGATLIRPFESAEENVARRKAIDEALLTLGAQPESMAFGAGKLTTEIAGTAGIGRVAAKPLGILASQVPATAKYLAPITAALESSGFTAGPTVTGLKAVAPRAIGGAATGAAATGLTEPGTAETGAIAGTATAFVAPPVVKTLAKSVGFLNDALRGRMATVKAGKLARDVAGDQIGAIRAALSASPSDITAAQATAGVQRNEWQALGELASKDNATFALLKRQAADDLSELQRLAQGANETEARALRDQAVKRLNQLTDDMRNVELQAANQAAQTINRLAPQQAQREASMINALREGVPVGAPLPGQATMHPATEAAKAWQRGQAEPVMRGQIPTVSTGLTPLTQARQWQETSDIFSDIAKQRRAEADFIERQIGSLEAHGLRPLDTGPLLDRLSATVNAPGIRASGNTVKVLQAIQDDINTLSARNNGVIDAHDLYTLRKEGINQRIAEIVGATDPKISAKLTKDILTRVKPLIDDAIEKAGGTGWRNYLETYSQGMQSIDKRAMAAELAKLFENTPDAYVKLVRGNNSDAVEAIFGPGSYNIFKEMSAEMPTLSKIAEGVERKATMKEMAAAGKEGLESVVEKHTSAFKIPWGLSAKTAATNKGLDILERRLNKKVREKVYAGMRSGQSMLELLNTLPASERSAALRALADPAAWKGKGAVAARAVAINSLAPDQEPQNALAP